MSERSVTPQPGPATTVVLPGGERVEIWTDGSIVLTAQDGSQAISSISGLIRARLPSSKPTVSDVMAQLGRITPALRRDTYSIVVRPFGVERVPIGSFFWDDVAKSLVLVPE